MAAKLGSVPSSTTKRRAKQRGFHPLSEDQLARLTFHGAAGEVTGSCFLLETRRSRLLLECGLVQGSPRAERRNAQRFPFDPRGLDAVVLTHAHIDHSGRLPKLIKDGYAGDVHVTTGTADLLGILLPDSAHIHEQDARHASRRRLRQGKSELEPLYTMDDAQRALDRLALAPYGRWSEVAPGVQVRFRRAGHILGSASVEVEIEDEGATRRLVLSGDVGRAQDPLLMPADPPDRADLLLLESTYGDRDHRDQDDTLDEFADILDQAAREGSNVIVPVFAVGRAQEVLHHLARFEREGRMRPRPVYLDSPMAISVTELYGRHRDSLRPELVADAPRQLHFCRTPDESMALNLKRGVVILAASGMCNAGRVVHHLKHNLWRGGSHVVFVGFQARGTPGRALVDGARKVRLLGESIAVRSKIHTVGGFSAHAGQRELVRWGASMIEGGAAVALVHGEPDRRDALRAALEPRTHKPIWSPLPGAAVMLTRRGSGAQLLNAGD